MTLLLDLRCAAGCSFRVATDSLADLTLARCPTCGATIELAGSRSVANARRACCGARGDGACMIHCPRARKGT